MDRVHNVERATLQRDVQQHDELRTALEAVDPETILDEFVSAMAPSGFQGATTHRYVYKSKMTYPRLRIVEKDRAYPEPVWHLGHLPHPNETPAYLATGGDVVIFEATGVGARRGGPAPRKPMIHRGRHRVGAVSQVAGGLLGGLDNAFRNHSGVYARLAELLRAAGATWPSRLPNLPAWKYRV